MARSRNPSAFPDAMLKLFNLLADPGCRNMTFPFSSEVEAKRFRFIWYSYLRAIDYWYKTQKEDAHFNEMKLRQSSLARRFEVLIQGTDVLFRDRNTDPFCQHIEKIVDSYRANLATPEQPGYNVALPPAPAPVEELGDPPETETVDDRQRSLLERLGFAPQAGKGFREFGTKSLEQLEAERAAQREKKESGPEAPAPTLGEE